MKTKEKSERLARNAASEMPGYIVSGCPIDIFQCDEAARKLSELTCLAELIAVAEAASVLIEFGYVKKSEAGNRCASELETLRAKLKEKGIEL